jgi:hypothetical protein
VFGTDRSTSVKLELSYLPPQPPYRKMMAADFPEVEHAYDVWHVVKVRLH